MSTAVSLMNNCRCLAALALLLPSMAEAASVIKPIVACKDEADSRRVLDFLGKNDKAGLDKFSAPKLAKGDCLSLSKGMAVTIDTKTASFSASALGAGSIATGRPMRTSIRMHPSRRHGRPRIRADIDAAAPIYRRPNARRFS